MIRDFLLSSFSLASSFTPKNFETEGVAGTDAPNGEMLFRGWEAAGLVID